MTTTIPPAALMRAEPVFINAGRLVLAVYSCLAREAYELNLHQFTSRCRLRHLRLFQVRRADLSVSPAIL